MAELSNRCGVSEADAPSTAGMRETLEAQQQLLQKLYAELDQEREASASAASEALSMILRLQGEKAAVKMEACQYKRLAEEKICHAEESLEVFEDLVYQKEMEIASLEFQVQAYKCRLPSLGCPDSPPGDTAGGGVSVRRHASLPPIPFKDSKVNKTPDLESRKSGHLSSGNFSSYLQQIRDLDEQVKEIARCDEVVTKPGSGLSETKPVQDIFEVPKLDEKTGKLSCLVDEADSAVKRVLVESDKAIAVVHPTAGLAESGAGFRELRKRIEKLEGERGSSGEEERKMLAEIQSQLNALQDEIRSWREERTPPAAVEAKKKDPEQVHCIKEAMLHFWS